MLFNGSVRIYIKLRGKRLQFVLCKKIINNQLKKRNVNFIEIKNELINGLVPILQEKTGRVPIILPVIMDIKDFKTQTKNS